MKAKSLVDGGDGVNALAQTAVPTLGRQGFWPALFLPDLFFARPEVDIPSTKGVEYSIDKRVAERCVWKATVKTCSNYWILSQWFSRPRSLWNPLAA
jgi:hypothetical protein